jgi:hypothetical protein
MDLRDYFAAHVAASLADRMERPEGIAARAYDLADALMKERVRRPASQSMWSDELPPEAFMGDDARGFARTGLLDEPAPISERDLDLSVLEHDAPAEWDAKPIVDVRASERPGLARTVATPTDDGKLKKSG